MATAAQLRSDVTLSDRSSPIMSTVLVRFFSPQVLVSSLQHGCLSFNIACVSSSVSVEYLPSSISVCSFTVRMTQMPLFSGDRYVSTSQFSSCLRVTVVPSSVKAKRLGTSNSSRMICSRTSLSLYARGTRTNPTALSRLSSAIFSLNCSHILTIFFRLNCSNAHIFEIVDCKLGDVFYCIDVFFGENFDYFLSKLLCRSTR